MDEQKVHDKNKFLCCLYVFGLQVEHGQRVGSNVETILDLAFGLCSCPTSCNFFFRKRSFLTAVRVYELVCSNKMRLDSLQEVLLCDWNVSHLEHCLDNSDHCAQIWGFCSTIRFSAVCRMQEAFLFQFRKDVFLLCSSLSLAVPQLSISLLLSV